MKILKKLAGAALAGAAMISLALPSAHAATPKDTLVMAWQFDDVISLDPAEAFELSAGEILGNSYETLIGYDVKDVSKIFGVVADSWTVSPDGKTLTFKLKPGKKFASGNPLTAEDVVFSLQRAVSLDKSPAFILGQFGLTKANVAEKVKQTGPLEFTFETDKAYAPTFVLYCMTANVASIVDKKLAMSHEKDGDFGYAWLKTNYAGSGPFKIREWRANEVVAMERNDNYSGEKPPLARVVYRHIKETATQRLLLEKGDIDIARNLGAEEIDAVKKLPDIGIQSAPKGTVYYIGLNQKNATLAKPEVREAMKWLVDYSAIADTILKYQVQVHQSFLPDGFLGASNENPYKLDVAKAKELLAKAGLKDGFSVTMDTRNTPTFTGIAQAVQQTFASAGIKLELIPGDGKQTLTKYRARQHDMFIGAWGADYQDPHTNADTFAANSNNADDAKAKPLAWRNAWDIPELTKTTLSAVLESDSAKRAKIYQDLQAEVRKTSPYLMMFQQIEVAAVRKNVVNFVLGPSFNTNSYAKTRKE
ncbi:MAG: ABC transporter substrate-binding protein [Beijerinckiaceae bacterium]|nr:ABC transporter substrate-binding protein [Beijerinckiaceae bacterium]